MRKFNLISSIGLSENKKSRRLDPDNRTVCRVLCNAINFCNALRACEEESNKEGWMD